MLIISGGPAPKRAKRALAAVSLVCILGMGFWCLPAEAGHSRSCYLDAGQSANGRYLVTAMRQDTFDAKGRRSDHRWEFSWLDRQSGENLQGELLGLRTGTGNVFDPVNAHIFVAPDGATFALWMPQSMARCEAKKPPTDDRDASDFHEFAGFSHRLTIYTKHGEVVRSFGVNEFLTQADWRWFHFHGRQAYWLVEYEGLDTHQTPRSGHALYRISPDYTVLEFQIGANAEAAHKAKERGISPPEPRMVRVQLTDGRIVTEEQPSDSNKVPVRPFVGELAGKESPQRSYEPSLDPVRLPGQYLELKADYLPVHLGRSSPLPKLALP